jgi:hypothetical protein
MAGLWALAVARGYCAKSGFRALDKGSKSEP